ncbi:hypothetical protein L1987_45112 [Smallanthus sonchifolius]|uniref:Uncharacterized protein n=1 Tax=Smallanthus sonchifolius TaxID=185202 RepID=A0ACB9GSE3_9ASTR|nr:hypothetical protein L1987_45112 [Smallanthus sonchifolius]
MRRSRTITEEARSDNRTPSVDDQIRDYRFSSRIRHRAAATVARRRGQRTLESQLDPEAQLRISQTRRARMVPAEWVLRPSRTIQPAVAPRRVDTRARLDGSLTLRFADYGNIPTTRRSFAVNEHDTEEINDEDEFVGMALINERYIEHGIRLLMQQEAAKRRPAEQIWDTLGQPSGKYDYYVSTNLVASASIIRSSTRH